MDPRRDVPRGSVLAMHTLLIAAILTLFLNTGLPEGAGFYGSSAFPLLDGFTAIFGTGKVTYLLGLLFMIGLIASFFTIISSTARGRPSIGMATDVASANPSAAQRGHCRPGVSGMFPLR